MPLIIIQRKQRLTRRDKEQVKAKSTASWKIRKGNEPEVFIIRSSCPKLKKYSFGGKICS